MKRLLDFVLALLGLIIFLVPMVFIALGILCVLGWPFYFRQVRIGRHGKPFTIIKFRTMDDDKNIPPFCKFLRTTAMDELTQLLHILVGQMSFVGPRPLIPEELLMLDKIPYGTRRQAVQPGLTGLAQLYATKVPSLEERLEWDLKYVDTRSIFLDVKLIVLSIWITLFGAWERKSKLRPGSLND